LNEILQAAGVADAAPQVDPRPRAQEVRQAIGIKRLLDIGQQDRKHAEPLLGRRPVDRDGDLLQLPRAQVVRADEHRARHRRVQPRPELALPVTAGRQRPSVQPGLDTGPLQAFGDLLDDLPVAAVVRQEDIESLRRGAHRREATRPRAAVV